MMRQLRITKNITNYKTASLEKYLQAIAKEETVSIEEEVDLVQRIKKGDEEALDKLVRANLRFVVSVAKQYQNQGLSLSDLINEGNLGLITAAQKYDETRGFKFISYAVWRIRQSILQALAQSSRTVRLPLNQVGISNKVYKALCAFEQGQGRPPVNEELAEILGISKEKIASIIAGNAKTLSLDKPMNSEDFDAGTLLEKIESDEFKEPDAGLYIESLRKEMYRSLSTLTPRETEILKLYYGLDQGHEWLLEEIAEKFDLTRERVRQIKEKAIRRLRHSNRSKLLRQYLGK